MLSSGAGCPNRALLCQEYQRNRNEVNRYRGLGALGQSNPHCPPRTGHR